MENAAITQGDSKESKKLALHYMETLTGISRESFLILDADLRVLSANPIFYQVFRVSPEATEGKSLYDLGNGQWDIPELKKLLGEILPEKKFVKDYEVEHVFESIGKKMMVLNAQQVDSVQLIILAIEDATVKKELEEKLADYTRELEAKVVERTGELTDRVKELESLNKSMVGREIKMVELKKEIEDLKKLTKNGNGNHNGNHNNGSQK